MREGETFSAFFFDRLQRARDRISDGDASPEVLAFTESADLLAPMCSLLPREESWRWRPSLPCGPQAADRMAEALYRLALSFYKCPQPPEYPEPYEGHLYGYGRAYFWWDKPALLADTILATVSSSSSPGKSGGSGGSGSSGTAAGEGQGPESSPGTTPGGSSGGMSPKQLGAAGQALHLFGCGIECLRTMDLAAGLHLLTTAISLLEDPEWRQECQAQLEQVAAQHGLPPFSAEQLLCVCHGAVAYTTAGELEAAAAEAAPAGWHVDQLLQLLQEAEAASLEELLQLQPNSPGCFILQGQRCARKGQLTEAAEQYLKAAELAGEQGSHCWKAVASLYQAAVMLHGAQSGSHWQASDIGKTVKGLLLEADVALIQCTRLLPESWVMPLTTKQQKLKHWLEGMAAQKQKQSEGQPQRRSSRHSGSFKGALQWVEPIAEASEEGNEAASLVSKVQLGAAVTTVHCDASCELPDTPRGELDD